jgi:hypothetical protein
VHAKAPLSNAWASIRYFASALTRVDRASGWMNVPPISTVWRVGLRLRKLVVPTMASVAR